MIPKAVTWQDKILFIETSEEKPNPATFKTMLAALDTHGMLKYVKAIIVGKPQDECYYEAYKPILLELTETYQTPILYNVNIGHAVPRAIMPYGLKTTIDFENKTMTVIESLFK